MTILTDGNGRPVRKPERVDYTSDLDYIRAYHAYRDQVAEIANAAFDTTFTQTMKKP